MLHGCQLKRSEERKEAREEEGGGGGRRGGRREGERERINTYKCIANLRLSIDSLLLSNQINTV